MGASINSVSHISGGGNIPKVLLSREQPIESSTATSTNPMMTKMGGLIIRPTKSSTATPEQTASTSSGNLQAYKQYASQQEFGGQLIQNAVQDQAGGISSVAFSTEGKKRLNMAQQLGIK